MKKNIATSIKSISLTLFFVMFLSFSSWGQVTIWTEDFSTSSNYSVTLGAEGNDGTADYFQRTDGANIGVSYSNNISDFFAAQDIDDTGWSGSASPSELMWTGINISGYSSLSFEGLFASAATAKIDDNDYVLVQINIDNAGWITIIEFENDGTQYNTYLLEDTDFNGTGDGIQLTSTFANFTKSISGTGSSMDIKITVAVNSGGEDFAFDEFYVKGTSSSPTPEIQAQIPSGTDVACDYTYDFGAQTTGSSTDVVLTIENTGSSDLDITDYPLTTGTDYSLNPTSTSATISASNSYNVTVTFSPTTTGTLTDIITISSNDSDEGTCKINLTGEGVAPCTEPSQATSLSFSGITSSSIDVSYTSSGADNYLVVQSTSSSLSASPVDATSYSVGEALGGGTVVYNNSGTSFTDNGLAANTTYYYYVFAYNNSSCSGGPNYNTTPLDGNETTLALPNLVITEIAGKGYGGDYNDEYIEISNFESYSVDLTSWELKYYESSLEKTVNLSGTLAANSAYVIAARSSHTAAISPDIVSSFSINNSCYATLLQNSAIIDEAGSSSDKFTDSKNYEFTDCSNDNKPVANWDDLGTNNGTPGVINCIVIEPEIEIQGNAIEIIDGDATPSVTDDTDFGMVNISGGTAAHVFTIKNTGNADLTVNSINSSNLSEFAISGTTSGTISSGNEITFTVTFDPSTTGIRTSTITVDNDDTDESTYDFVVDGNGADACATPTSQATDLILNSNTTLTSIDGSFTAASPTADSYLIVYSTSSTLSSTPVDGTTYSSGDALGGGTVLDNISSTTFTASGLTSGTEYFFFIFANNNLSCADGPSYNTSSPLTGNEITIPDTVNWTNPGCISNSTIELNWDAAPGGSTGYLLVVRSEATPHVITSLDPTTDLSENLDYSVAAQFGSTTEYSRVLYKGTATSVTVTGLPTTDCVFKIYTYTIGANGSDYVYSSGTQQTNTITLDNVSSAGASCGDSQSSISWANPNLTCIDEILVVANETSGIDFSPSGDGTAYSANTIYTAANQVVYQGTGTTVTVTSLTNGTTYYYEIFTRKGTEWSAGVEVSCTPNEVTVLYPGDLAIVAINTQYTTSVSDDEVCFFAFKDITNGTAIDFTDNGYERLTSGKWADSEGTIRLERNGPTIEKGTVICFHGKGGSSNNFTINVCGSSDDANWSISSLNGSGSYDLNVNDQIWIMQDGNWTNPSGSHDATYDGNVLFGWTATGWKSAPGYDDTKGSTLFDGAECFNTDVAATTNEDKVKFLADTTQTLSQSAWIGQINSDWNWQGYSDNPNYNSGGLDYSGSCVKFNIDNSLGNGAGMWEGGEDNNWFNCANWLNMQVPDENIDVTILSNAHNEANIDDTQEDASIYGPIAKCKNLTIQEGGDTIYIQIDDANDELQVKQTLTIESKAKIHNDNGGTVSIEGDLNINDGGLFDIHANPGIGSIINLKGNWTDNNTLDNDTLGLFETGGQVIFIGTSQQTISDATGNETFYNLKINNSSGLDINGNNATISNILDLTSGEISTANDTVIVTNTDIGSIINHSNSSYVNGNLRRSVSTSGSYDFPVGTVNQYEIANINLNSSTGINNFNANFTEHPGSAALVDGGGIPLNLTINGTTLSEMLDYGFWTIKPDATSYSVNYDVTLTSRGHTNGGSDPAQHTIVKRDDNTDNWATYESNHDNSTQSGTGTNPITAKLSGMLAFSDFAIAKDAQFPLPVKLLYFTAKETKNGILLEWATASEINNDLFILNKSNQDMNFGKLSIINGSGNSNTIIKYEYLDKTLTSGLSYYQLIQQDFDGSKTDEGIISISHESIINYRIINEHIEISSIKEPESVNVDIYNTIGQKVKTISKIESNKIIIDLSDLPSKVIYLIRIKTSDNETLIKYFK